MITISLCMIVRNEQDTLERCLQSVQDIVDEIIIVDTGSTDRTKEIASKWTQHIFDFKWIDDFAAARNFSFAKATMNYILWLDADDVLLPVDSQKLFQLKQFLSPEVDTLSMQYHCDFDDHGNVSLNVRRIRLVKRSRNYQWEGVVHEDLSLKGKDGNFYDSDIVVTHKRNHSTSDPDRNLKIYETLLLAGKEFTLRDTLHYAMELHQHRMYQQAIEFYLKFMDMENITTEDRIHACSKLADCYYHLGDREQERAFIFKSFEYDTPRPEYCCRLGYYFLEKSQFSQAAFWYKLATELPMPNNCWAIQNHASHTWLPHTQLGLCYYQMGEYQLSYHHNKIALSYRPNDLGIINNINLLDEIMKKK
ncbi:glycosyltransferase family 2 protein [Sporomusa sp.]|uniref:glycosyltransferase family 2 protein n=1 Tax=Sporomusa sp. TaxID=2078658 RepID=UPI002B91BCB5|nr:glycosyltransferase family 2 protein [Sporomusa sp.]HWR45068.1 glycosyltransferase family 2 protein [Sporomusa sp.]